MSRTIAVAALCVVATVALGDGGMFRRVEVGQSEKLVASHRQEAMLVADGERVTVTLRTHFRTGPKELAWIVPVPTKPDRIDPADAVLFTELDRLTAPRFVAVETRGKGGGCGCGGMAMRANGPMVALVTVEASGTAGVFAYEVLAATDAAALEKWLREHKYYVPDGADEVFDRYVKAGWRWLAVRIRPELADKKDLAPHPIRYSYRADRLTYPMVISRLSAATENEILLYVVSLDNRYACANWANTTVADLAGQIDRDANVSHTPAAYANAFRAATAANAGRLFVTEMARPLLPFESEQLRRSVPSWPQAPAGKTLFVTRLRAVMAPSAMTRDVELVPTYGWPTVTNQVYVYAPAPGASGPPRGVAIVAVGVGVFLACVAVVLLVGGGATPGRRARRIGGWLCLVAACLAACVS